MLSSLHLTHKDARRASYFSAMDLLQAFVTFNQRICRMIVDGFKVLAPA